MTTRLTLKIFFAAIITLVTSSAFAGTTLKLASVAPTASPWGKWLQAVADAVEKKSAGDLKLELVLDAQAGDEQTILNQTVRGRIDVAFVSNAGTAVLAPETSLVTAPYLFDTAEQGTCVIHNHLTSIFNDTMSKKSMVPLTWMEVGYNIIFSKEAIGSPADLKGKKMRIAPSPVEPVLADALGYAALPMGTSDAIPAIQTGAVDGAFFPTVFGIAIGTPKVAPHVTVTNHSRLVGTASISQKKWDGLTEKQQEILSSTFAEMGPGMTKAILGAEAALLAKVTKGGAPVFTPSKEELVAWKKATDGVLKATVKSIGGDAQSIADKLAKAKAACNS